MHVTPISRAQRACARLAGYLFLLNYALVIVGQFVPSTIRGSGDVAERAQRVLASESLYRVGLTSMTVGWVSIVVLAFALFVSLEPVHRRLAQLALCFRLGESFVGGASLMASFAMLRFYREVHAGGAVPPDLATSLAGVAGGATGSGFNIAMAFFSPGSLLFFLLFFRSGYIPRALAALGVFGSGLMFVVALATLLLPQHAGLLQLGWAPIGVAELVTALWLAVVGIRQPKRPAVGAAPASPDD